MKRQLAIAATLSAFIGVLDHAIAQAPSALKEKGPYDLPRAQYLAARTSLAKAVIAEEGWSDRRGHSAVAFVYSRKYKGRSKARTTFQSIIERHCSALRPGRQANGSRARLIVGLPQTADSDPRRLEAWEKTLTFLDRWYQGQVKDPCEGEPVDFGSRDDVPPVGAVRVHCEGVDNRYYEIRRK